LQMGRDGAVMIANMHQQRESIYDPFN